MRGWWLLGLVACGAEVVPPEDDETDRADSDVTEVVVDCDRDDDGVLRVGDGCSPVGEPDCDDDDTTIRPGAEEVCDGVDNDCSGAADEPFDADGDGQAGCAGDCDDDDAGRSEQQPERCDGRDNDCDSGVDEGFDLDGDGQATCRGDCDDGDPRVALGLEELCDGVDNDCDPTTSEDGDLDGDGLTFCGGDCDDGDASAYPGGEEVCDGADNDCDGRTDPQPECFGCAPTSFGWFCGTAVPWETARQACIDFGGMLALAQDAVANQSVSDAAWGDCWIGLSDRAVEGDWRWEDGTSTGYTSWAPGEPNDAGGEDCAATNFQGRGLWNDWPCGSSLAFACTMP